MLFQTSETLVWCRLSLTLNKFHGTVPPNAYNYADGGGHQMIKHLKVQMRLIVLFLDGLDHDLDEVIASRPAAGNS